MPRVMLVDDEPAVIRLYSIALGKAGFEVVAAAADGSAAVGLWRAARPDVILMDHRMPVMDGLAASRAILADEPGARIVFVSADESVEREAVAAGVARFVRKPADCDDIVRAVRDAAGKCRPAPDAPRDAAASPARPRA